ncbi:hypothetical protein ABLO27_19540 [Roseibium sp. SCPC15]|uniref:hypothetical protein n=1 Tax=Roseibium sp. SCP15 TaxID=3141376 RepID=UPI003335EF72
MFAAVDRLTTMKASRACRCCNAFFLSIAVLLTACFYLLGATLAARASSELDLEQTDDPELRHVLQRAFVLPMMLDLPDVTYQRRNDLISAEAEKLEGILRSLGYLAATVEVSDDMTSNGYARLTPVPGSLYRIGWIRAVGLPDGLPEETLIGFDDHAARFVGQTATAGILEELKSGLIWRLREASYASGEVLQLKDVLDPQLRSVGISFAFLTGRSTHVADVQVQGSRHADLLSELASSTVKEGEPYSEAAMARLRELLEQTALFNRVDVSLSNVSFPSGTAEVEVKLVDKPPEPHFFQSEAGLGPVLAILTMLLIVLRECAGPDSMWMGRPIGPALTGTVAVFYAINVIVIVAVLVSIISVQI